MNITKLVFSIEPNIGFDIELTRMFDGWNIFNREMGEPKHFERKIVMIGISIEEATKLVEGFLSLQACYE